MRNEIEQIEAKRMTIRAAIELAISFLQSALKDDTPEGIWANIKNGEDFAKKASELQFQFTIWNKRI